MTWARCRGWILPALRDGTEADLVADIEAGRAQLWPGCVSAVVTQCVVETDSRCLHAWLAGGDLAEIVAMIPGIEAWGRAMGCDHATVTGRRGWTRALRRLGYVRVDAELRKAL